MWWAGSGTVDAYLGTRSLGLSLTPSEWLWSEAAGIEDALLQFAQRLQPIKAQNRWRRRRLRVRLSGGLARPFVVQPMSGVRGVSEFQTIAERLAPEAVGMAGPCRVWLEGFGDQDASIAVAAQQVVIDGIAKTALEAGLSLAFVRPWWGDALSAALLHTPEPHAILVEEQDALTLLAGAPGKFSEAISSMPAVPREEISKWVTRALLGAEVSVGHLLRARMGACEGAVASWNCDVVLENWS